MSAIIESLWENVSYLPLKQNLKGKHIRLKQWPNFGFSDYRPEYISLSTILTYDALTAKELEEISGFNEHIIHSFLNAAYLMELVDITEVSQTYSYTFSERINICTAKLKQVLSFELI